MELTPATVEQYTDLIISQHRTDMFIKVVALSVQPFVDMQNKMIQILRNFDVDIAYGGILDFIGQWVGVSRNVETELTDVYFQWDGLPEVGWDQGSWKGPNDPSTGLTTIPDDAYRTLIKAKIGANNWDGTNDGIAACYNGIFVNGAQVVVTDNLDMTMDVTVVGGPLTAVEAGLIRTGALPLRPAAVLARYFIGSSTGLTFAWDVSNSVFGGWDVAEWATEQSPLI